MSSASGRGGGLGGVTVVIPTRNRWPLLSVTLASVLAQQDVDLDVVVVDDASDDGSDLAVSAVTDNRVTVLRNPTRSGVAAARNIGLRAARQRWVAFTDDDDPWAPRKLAQQLAALHAFPKARWSCVGALNVDDDLRVIGEHRPPPSGDVADAILRSNRIPGGGSGVVANRALMCELGGFDEALRNSADVDMWIRLALAAPLASVDEPLLAYRVHTGGMSRLLDDIYDEIAYVHAKHRETYEAHDVQPTASLEIWIADRHQRAGHRVAAARAYLRANGTLRGRTVSRAVEALLWPGAYRWRDRRRARSLPPDRLAAATTWLEAIKNPERAHQLL